MGIDQIGVDKASRLVLDVGEARQGTTGASGGSFRCGIMSCPFPGDYEDLQRFRVAEVADAGHGWAVEAPEVPAVPGLAARRGEGNLGRTVQHCVRDAALAFNEQTFVSFCVRSRRSRPGRVPATEPAVDRHLPAVVRAERRVRRPETARPHRQLPLDDQIR